MLMKNALIKTCVLDGEYSSFNWENSSIRIGYDVSSNSLFKEDTSHGFSFNWDSESTCSHNSSFYSSHHINLYVSRW